MLLIIYIMCSTHFDEVQVTFSSLVRHAGQVGVPLLAVLSHHGAVVERVLLQEALGRVVAVDVDLGQGVVGSRPPRIRRGYGTPATTAEVLT